MAEVRGEKEQSKGVRAATREERKEQSKKEQPKSESRSVRRDSKKSGNSLIARFRNSTLGRFILESYYELRHKVTWPTRQEAWNMTLAVVILSAIVGVILIAADFGLERLYFLIVGK